MEEEIMIKYIGVKQIKATPMTKEEVFELAGYQNKTCDREPTCMGYLIEYEGGYQSWSPKDVFDEAYQMAYPDEHRFDVSSDCETLAPHISRMCVEFDDVFEKTKKLAEFVLTDFFDSLDSQEQCRLQKQLKAMVMYRDVLYERIDNS